MTESPTVALAREIGANIAAPAAEQVDQESRFPTEAIVAAASVGLLAAYVPRVYGGLGCTLTELVAVAEALAAGCAATGMIWSMHQIQIACLVHHGPPSRYMEDALRRMAQDQSLVASVTSEVGVGGDIRTSLAAIETGDGACHLTKHAPTISYGLQAADFLVTARRAADAASGDQVLALVSRDQAELTQVGEWNALGMRGTCSPAFDLRAAFPPEAVLPVAFANICAQTMVPVSHVLWSACWLGIAESAAARARRYLRARARQTPDSPLTGERDLAEVGTMLGQMRALIDRSATRYAAMLGECAPGGVGGFNVAFAAEMNDLKLASSELVVGIVSRTMAICGIAGYRVDGPYTLGRHLRDAYSAICMISNDRLRAANAAVALLGRGG